MRLILRLIWPPHHWGASAQICPSVCDVWSVCVAAPDWGIASAGVTLIRRFAGLNLKKTSCHFVHFLIGICVNKQTIKGPRYAKVDLFHCIQSFNLIICQDFTLILALLFSVQDTSEGSHQLMVSPRHAFQLQSTLITLSVTLDHIAAIKVRIYF